LTLPLLSAAGCPGSYFNRKAIFHFAELDDLNFERPVEFAAERRNLAAVRIGARPLRRRVEVRNISEMIGIRPA